MDDCSERDRAALRHFMCPSWPGLSRRSSPRLLGRRKKDVDARDQRGHGVEKVTPSLRDAP
jgi:hypothetical protein